MHTFIVIVVVLLVLAFQFRTFIKVRSEFEDYSSMFRGKNEAYIDDEKRINFKTSNGVSNNLLNIVRTLNKYLEKNGNAVVDYHLMKDVIDRHCDRIENNISSQLPFPLYAGLVGTMIGIVVGVVSISLNLDDAGASGKVLLGVDSFTPLLVCVGVAMFASAVGVVLTTWLTNSFKEVQETLSTEKDSFLSWIQAELLPNVGSDFTSAMTKMAGTLASFNETFEDNVGSLGATLSLVNDSSSNQVELIKRLEELKVTKLVSANVDIYDKLKNCTEEIGGLADQLEALKKSSEKHCKNAEKLATLLNSWESEIEERKSKVSMAMSSFDIYVNKLKEGWMEQTQKMTDDLSMAFSTQSDMIEKRVESLPTIVKEIDNLSNIKKLMEEMISATKKQGEELKKLTNSIDGLAQAKTTGAPISVTNPLLNWWNSLNKFKKFGLVSLALSVPVMSLLVLIERLYEIVMTFI